jgi:type I restriction enzyme M protein
MTTEILTRDELNRQLWQAADILRGTVDAGDYKNHIFTLMFLKRLSDVFDERREEIIRDWMAQGRSRREAEDVANDPDEYGEGSFFVPEEARWNALMAVGENRAEDLDVAVQAIEEQNARYLEGVLTGVRFNDPRRFGDPTEMDGTMQRLLTHFAKIPLGNRNLAEPDVLGNAYEYLIERFADASGKKGGEFYTPREVVRLIVEILQPAEGMRIHDPTCGSGGMLIECAHFVAEHGMDARNLTLTGQEKNMGTLAICKLNMLLHNAPDADIRGGDTIRNPKFVEGGVLNSFDRVIANPPFSLKDWGHEFASENPKDRTHTGDPYRRFARGLPPRTKGDMAFLLHMVEVCNSEGRIGVVMPHGVLFRGGAERKVREALLREDLFEAVIGLPEKLFFGTGIPAAVLILNRNKPKERHGKVLFVDASRFYTQEGNRNKLRLDDILRVAAAHRAYAEPGELPAAVDGIAESWRDAQKAHNDRQHERLSSQPPELATEMDAEGVRKLVEIDTAREAVHEWIDAKHPGKRTSLDKLAQVVPLRVIEDENDFNLNISRYVDPTDPPPRLSVKRELKKLRKLEEKRNAAEEKMNQLLAEIGYEG